MKKALYILGFVTFTTLLTSCTADEIPTAETDQQATTSFSAKDGDEIDPPKVTPPPPPPPPVVTIGK